MKEIKGVISLFGEHFIKTRIFDKELGKALSEAFDKRLIGDYSIGFLISEQEAKNLLDVARNFVSKTKEYLKEFIEKE